MKKVLVLGGHFGSGFRVFQSGFHFTLQYGFIHREELLMLMNTER